MLVLNVQSLDAQCSRQNVEWQDPTIRFGLNSVSELLYFNARIHLNLFHSEVPRSSQEIVVGTRRQCISRITGLRLATIVAASIAIILFADIISMAENWSIAGAIIDRVARVLLRRALGLVCQRINKCSCVLSPILSTSPGFGSVPTKYFVIVGQDHCKSWAFFIASTVECSTTKAIPVSLPQQLISDWPFDSFGNICVE